MIIKSIELENYRPYKGPEKIEFAEGEKNITIIQGENDAGKTSLLNAITWCLYGEEQYRQKGKEKIWNKTAVNNLSIGDNITVKVEVIMIDNQGQKVTFTRSQNFIKRDEFKCSEVDTTFDIFINDGVNDKIVTFTDDYMDTHLPETLREYYLFDGEQLTQFFNKESKGVKNAVYNLSQLNLLEKVTKHIKARKTEFVSDQKKLSPKLGEFQEKKDSLIEQSEKDKKTLADNKNNIEKWEQTVTNLEIELRSFGEDPDKIIQEKNNINVEIRDKKLEYDRKNIEYRKFLTSNFSVIFGYNDLLKLKEIGADLESKGYIPARFKKEFLEYLVEEKQCICGADLSEGSEGYKKIEQLIQNTDEVSNISETVNMLLGSANTIISSYPNDFHEKLIEYKQDLQILDTDIIKLNQQLKNLEIKLGQNKEEKVRKLQSDIKDYEGYIRSATEKNGILKQNLEDFQSKLNKINNEIKKEQNKKDKETELDKNIDFCEKIINITQQLYNELAQEIHDNLQALTTEEFRNIHWKKAYESVIIDNDFNVSFKKTDGSVIAATDPSSGSQLTLALSFMTALNSLSGFELPIIIDTPLGRLGNKIRENLGEFLPEYTKNKQVTLIVTDTEYAGEFKEKIKNYVGKEYLLQYSDENGEQTRVVKC